jgi:hypothetical protein
MPDRIEAALLDLMEQARTAVKLAEGAHRVASDDLASRRLDVDGWEALLADHRRRNPVGAPTEAFPAVPLSVACRDGLHGMCEDHGDTALGDEYACQCPLHPATAAVPPAATTLTDPPAATPQENLDAER